MPSDTARCQAKILGDLRIGSANTVVGASIGGIQALEFVAKFPNRLNRLVGLPSSAILADSIYKDGSCTTGVPLDSLPSRVWGHGGGARPEHDHHAMA